MYRHNLIFRINNPFPFPTALSQLAALHFTQGDKGLWPSNLTPHPDPSKVRFGRLLPHFIVELKIGNGAGYVQGLSLWLAWNALDTTAPLHSARRKEWDFGVTRSAQRVPYSDGH